jgi:hypothetical protein
VRPVVAQVGGGVARGIHPAIVREVNDRAHRREPQNRERQHQRRQHHHLDFLLLDLLAQVFGRAAHHQAGDKHRQDGEQQHAVEARAHASENHFAQLDIDQRHQAAQRRQAVVRVVHRAATGVGGNHREKRRVGNAEARLLAFHVAAGLRVRGGRLNPHLSQIGISGRLRTVSHKHARQEQHAHGGEERPALPRVLHHFAEGVSQPGGNDKDVEHLQEVRKGSGVLEGMSRIGVGEAAAIGADHLDGFLRCQRALRNGLYGSLYRCRLGIGVEVLDGALGDQQQRAHHRERQQNVDRAPGEIHPEAAQRFHRVARKPAREGDSHGDSRGRRPEVMRRQRDHLADVTHGGFGHVRLPVGIGAEADGSVERQVRPHVREALRVERQPLLDAQQHIAEQDAGQAESQHCPGVDGPVLLAVFIDAADFVQAHFERAQHRVQESALAGEYLRHEGPQRLGQRQQDEKVQRDLQNSVSSHAVLFRTFPGKAGRRTGTRPAPPQSVVAICIPCMLLESRS